MLIYTNRVRMFSVKYISATNCRPSRVRIKCLWFGDSVILSRDTDIDIVSQAKLFLDDAGIEITTDSVDIDNGIDYLMTDKWFATRIKGRKS